MGAQVSVEKYGQWLTLIPDSVDGTLYDSNNNNNRMSGVVASSAFRQYPRIIPKRIRSI